MELLPAASWSGWPDLSRRPLRPEAKPTVGSQVLSADWPAETVHGRPWEATDARGDRQAVSHSGHWTFADMPLGSGVLRVPWKCAWEGWNCVRPLSVCGRLVINDHYQ